MNFNFTPTEEPQDRIEVPFFEDARAGFAPYYSSQKSVQDAKSQVGAELAKLGASDWYFKDGFFGDDPRRYGYEVKFVYMGLPGKLMVAGLPLRGNETPGKLRQVRVQALLNVRDWLKVSVTQQVFSPGAHPLVVHLLQPGMEGEKTIGQVWLESMVPKTPLLGAGEVIEAEFSEV